MTLIPYPLRAAKVAVEFAPFSWWLKPQWQKRSLTEPAKEAGETIWYARWLCVQISYSRWV